MVVEEDEVVAIVETADPVLPVTLDAVLALVVAVFGGPKNDVMLPFARGFLVDAAESSAALRFCRHGWILLF